ncbi:MAG: hypothetical protein IJZ86_05785 [Bacteroides sp.]|nr:hypothetical protein [Bacteroides sp.]
MNLNKDAKELIKRNSMLLCSLMKQMYHYTFNELQHICQLGDTDLCLAIVRLLQEGKLQQSRNGQNVYYMLVG